MPIAFRKALSSLILCASLVTPLHAQTQPTPTVSSEANELAVALVGLKSEVEQDQLLAQKQDLKHDELVRALRALSDPLVNKGDYNEALRISQLALRIAQKTSDQMLLAKTMYELGAIYARRIPSDPAVSYLEKSLKIFEELGARTEQARAFQAIAAAYNNDRKRTLALEYNEKALVISQEVGNKSLTARIFNGLGATHLDLGNYNLARDYFLKAQALSEEANDLGTLNFALSNLGMHYTRIGRYAEGLDYMNRSLKVQEAMGSKADRRSLGLKLQNIGLIYRRQGQLDQAIAYARRSLAIFEEVDDKFGIANLQNNIGVVYKAQGNYEEAMGWFRKALQGYEALKATPGIARCMNNIGDTYRSQGRYAEALPALQKGLQLREQNRDRGGVSLSLNNLAQLYYDERKYSDMLDVSRRSLTLAQELNSLEEQWMAQEQIGRALIGLGRASEARKSFLASINTLEIMRRQVAGGEQQQQSFFENKLAPWLGMVELLAAEGKYAEALSFAEQSKARVLLDALQAGRVNLQSLLSKEEQQVEEKHRKGLVSLNSQLIAELRKDKPDAARVDELKASVEKARLEYEDFETRLYVSHPQLRLQRGETPIIKGPELNALIPDASSALLEYVVAEDKTYLFVATKGKTDADVRLYTLPVKRNELAKHTDAFRQQLASRDLGFRGTASKLYELLLKPAEAQLSQKSNLIISPDNTLWDLPFQALVNGGNRFVIEDSAIAYAPSFTVLREMTRRKEKQSAHANYDTLLALGNPVIGSETLKKAALTLRDGKLDPLPEAEQEVKALGRLYGVARSKVYIGAEAREDRVKSEASRARILHFATHGILNNASPMYSHLALAEGGVGQDGLLEAWELMELNLQADLAVLSACETARGRIGAGEGMIGFSWAMFMAGVPSIVVSQWKVESAGTRDLMVNFHRSLIASRSTKSDALRQASLKVMKNPATSHPFYWAGFVLVGDGR